jgi:hypothetical protein
LPGAWPGKAGDIFQAMAKKRIAASARNERGGLEKIDGGLFKSAPRKMKIAKPTQIIFGLIYTDIEPV